MLKKFPSHIQSRTRGGRLCSGEQSHSWMRRFVMSRLHPCLTFFSEPRGDAPHRLGDVKTNTHTHKKQRFKSASLAGEPNHPSESRLHSTLIEKLNRKKKQELGVNSSENKNKDNTQSCLGCFFSFFLLLRSDRPPFQSKTTLPGSGNVSSEEEKSVSNIRLTRLCLALFTHNRRTGVSAALLFSD